MWVKEMFEGRGKNGEFHMFFPLLLEQPCKFYDCFSLLLETFGTN
jgi:hypothetical protein